MRGGGPSAGEHVEGAVHVRLGVVEVEGSPQVAGPAGDQHPGPPQLRCPVAEPGDRDDDGVRGDGGVSESGDAGAEAVRELQGVVVQGVDADLVEQGEGLFGAVVREEGGGSS